MAKFQREKPIVDDLNRGVSVVEIAARVGLSEKRMRAVIREILARRMPGPPEEFVAIQLSRLNEALLVAFSAMTGANLKAVDRVVRIVRELDRYHGFVAAAGRRPEAPPRIAVRGLDAPAEGTAAFGAALVCRPEFALQDFEKIESAPGVSLGHEATSPDLVLTPGLDPGVSKDVPVRPKVATCWSMLRDATRCVAPQHEGGEVRPAASAGDNRPGIPPQAFEKIESAPGIADVVAAWSMLPTSSVRPPGFDPGGRGDPEERRTPDGPWIATPPLGARDDGGGSCFGPAQSSPLGGRARPGIRPQTPEKIESAPGNGWPAEAPPAPDDSTPMIRTPTGWRRQNIRILLNGVAAC
jgi:hypothetical protein